VPDLLTTLREAESWWALLRQPRYLLSFTGIIMVVAMAAGAGLYFGDWVSALAIGLAVLFIVIVIVFLFIILSVREQRVRDAGTQEGDDETATRKREEERQRQALATMEQRFGRALDELRRSRLGREGVHELPWLLVLGEPGCGKSTAIGDSGLDLPAEYAKLVSGGPTNDCDFWLSNEAVVLDTAGWLLDADSGHRRTAWRKLLKLVRKARRRPALEGLIVCLPVNSLLLRGAKQLEDDARKLRRRLNELKDALKVDLPIYVFVTKSDLLEGFVETAMHLPPMRLAEAFGWTNAERRFADAGDVVIEGLEQVRDRVDRFMPEMVMREPDPTRRRRVFLFPQEFAELTLSLATFVRRAFAPSVYDETPFLRGVYFTSGKREGTAVSAVLPRLGHEWAQGNVQEIAPGRGFFMKELFGEVIIPDRELALPTGRIGRLARRFILGSFALAALAAIALLGISFRGHQKGLARLEADARTLVAASASLPVLDRLRGTIQGEEQRAKARLARLGFERVFADGLTRAKRAYVFAFAREFEEPTKANLMGAVRRYDDNSFEALAELALDITWLASKAGFGLQGRPHLHKFAQITRNEQDQTSFTDGYDAFVLWASDAEIQQRTERERELLAGAAATLLDLTRLERWSELNVESHPPARYSDVGLPPPPPGVAEGVPGAYTRRTWEALVRGLIAGVDRSGGASRAALEQFRQSYIRRYENLWRQYVMDTPTPPSVDPSVKQSAYVRLVEQIADNVRADLPRDVPPPSYITTVTETRREKTREELAAEAAEAAAKAAEGTGESTPEPKAQADATPAAAAPAAAPEKEDVPPWRAYLQILDQVGADVQGAQIRDEVALDVAKKVAAKEPTSFRQSLDQVRALVAQGGDPQLEEKLREILSMPILNGFSVVLVKAMEAMDRRWVDQIAGKYPSDLSEPELKELYTPNSGALARFKKEVLGPFYLDGRPVGVLGDREMSFGPNFLDWLRAADRVQRAMFPGLGDAPKITVQIDGIPSRVVGGGVLVTRRDLTVICGQQSESFVYREGTGSYTFAWTPECQEVALRVWVRGGGGQDRELRPTRTWRGPLAFPRFFQEAQSQGGGRFQWTLRYPDEGAEIVIVYGMRTGESLLSIAHTPAPPTVRE
jgi:type VI protein secretion system component VasK